MKVATLSDIHSNSIALKAVLEDLPPVDEIICLGDVVGYGPHPSEAVELVREHASVSLYGNHEHYLSNHEEIKQNHGAYEGVALALDDLSEDQIDWLADRPMRGVVDDTLRISHGHPDPNTPFKYVKKGNVTELIPYFEAEDTLMATGHSHIQFKIDLRKFEASSGIFYNPGSVGQPRDGDPRAAYAVIDTDTATVDLHRVEYDIEKVIKDINDANLPEFNGTRLRR